MLYHLNLATPPFRVRTVYICLEADIPTEGSSSSFSIGFIVGLSVGGSLLLIAIAVGAVCRIYRRRRPRESERPSSGKVPQEVVGEASMSQGEQGAGR